MKPILALCLFLLQPEMAAALDLPPAPNATVFYSDGTSRKVKGLTIDGVFYSGADTGMKFKPAPTLGIATPKGEQMIPVSSVTRISFALTPAKSERGYPVYDVLLALRAAKGAKPRMLKGKMALTSITGDYDPVHRGKFWSFKLGKGKNGAELRQIAFW